ncbi:MAG: hypothetical protein F4W93_13155 [Dehalococcoidia bacterium]|nr:hypothetical protein [Dehalococcoidia bacterium]
MSGISLRKVWIGVAIALSAVAWACTVPAHTPLTPVRVHIPVPTPEGTFAPVPTLEATPERAPWDPPSLFVVDRSESSLSVAWNSEYNAMHYELRRSDSEDGEYAIVATKVAALGLVDEGLQPDSVYYYVVRACNDLGCSEFNDDPVAGLTESDADVDAPAVPKIVRIGTKIVVIFPDLDVVIWTEVEGATYYKVYRAGRQLSEVSAPLTHSSHVDLGRSWLLSSGTSYQVSACNKAGCSPRSQKVFQGEGVSRGNAEIERTPANAGADVSATDANVDPLPGEDVSRGNVEIVPTPVDAGTDVSEAKANDDILLPEAIWREQIDIVRTLVDAGADVNAPDVLGNPLLQIAVRGNKADIVQILIDAGADVNARGMHGDPILHEAVDSPFKNAEVVRMLIGAGADVNARDRFGELLLHKAISHNRANVAQLLVDAGADVNATDAFGDSPLQVARWYRRTEIVEILLEAGAVE